MKDLVFVAGWGFDSRVWQPVAERLAGDFRISYELDAAPEGAIVCGWSLGALRVLRESATAERLVLVAATPRFVKAPDWTDAQAPELLDGFSAAVIADPQAALRRFAALMNQGDAQAREITRQLNGLLRERIPDSATLATGLAALRDTDLRKSAALVRQPTLLIHGEHDPLMPPAAAQWLADHMPDARLEVFAGTAHAPFLSQPDRFAQRVREFAG
ncbi:MAG: alpha/beta fold hydrolase [Rhodocyclales bacterium]|nr:alpha/beta fold hydrolase [Rhodocyclales bacterium]